MDSTETHARHPDRPTVAADPAYDDSEDLAVDEDWEDQSEVLTTTSGRLPSIPTNTVRPKRSNSTGSLKPRG